MLCCAHEAANIAKTATRQMIDNDFFMMYRFIYDVLFVNNGQIVIILYISGYIIRYICKDTKKRVRLIDYHAYSPFSNETNISNFYNKMSKKRSTKVAKIEKISVIFASGYWI